MCIIKKNLFDAIPQEYVISYEVFSVGTFCEYVEKNYQVVIQFDRVYHRI